MKLVLFICASILFVNCSYGQEKYFTKSGHIDFFSHSPLEDIKADNEQVLSIINVNKKEVLIYALMKSFMFKKALMQEHFNENYVESDKYPKAIFKGKISSFDLQNSSEQKVKITGTLTIHGATKNAETEAVLVKKDGQLSLVGNFMVTVADFGIKIPLTVTDNIAKQIKISFNLDHDPFQS